jgi:hypothetical protein
MQMPFCQGSGAHEAYGGCRRGPDVPRAAGAAITQRSTNHGGGLTTTNVHLSSEESPRAGKEVPIEV